MQTDSEKYNSSQKSIAKINKSIAILAVLFLFSLGLSGDKQNNITDASPEVRRVVSIIENINTALFLISFGGILFLLNKKTKLRKQLGIKAPDVADQQLKDTVTISLRENANMSHSLSSTTASLLARAATPEKIRFVREFKQELEYKKAPREDGASRGAFKS